MSFLRSLFAGVSGLRSHQVMMDVLGNNIANVNTIGFKAGRITFGELFAQTLRSATQPSVGLNGGTNPMQVGLGTSINSLDTLFGQGGIENTGQRTDLAIQGTGFFVVKKNGQHFYTRVGTFVFDANGFLVNPGNGAILQGKLADSQGNIPPGTALQDIKIALDSRSPANPTSTVRFGGNLDAAAVAGDTASGSVTIFDSLGNKHNLIITYTKGANPNEWTWAATMATPTTATFTGGNTGTITFNPDGTLNSFTYAGGASGIGINPGNGANNLTVSLNVGTPTTPPAPGNFAGITQTQGTSSIVPREQDGYGSGELSEVFIDATGKITGAYSNGKKLDLAQIMLAEFNNPSGLTRVGDNLYDISGNSGIAGIIGAGGSSKSTIVGGALEQSNVDLSEEFTRMILAQRGFQANARVITTSDEFLQEVVNLKR